MNRNKYRPISNTFLIHSLMKKMHCRCIFFIVRQAITQRFLQIYQWVLLSGGISNYNKNRKEWKAVNAMKILYFTATGNSLYAARQIGGEQLSIPQLIKEGNYEVKDDAVGIVCPVYCGNIPKMVRRFLAKATIIVRRMRSICRMRRVA